jgi:hypothetical protein
MEKRTCSICGQDKPLDKANFRWRVQDGHGYFTGECKVCIARAKTISRERAADKRRQALQKIEEVGVDAFVKSTLHGGSNIPHTAELVERVFQYFGGVGGFSAVLVKQYWDSPPGGSARSRLLETMCRLVTKNVESGGAKKPLQLWSEDELEQELEERMAEAVASFKGITIDATQEKEPKRIGAKEEAPAGIPASIAAAVRDHEVSARLLKRTAKRDSGAQAGGSAALQTEPESGEDT